MRARVVSLLSCLTLAGGLLVGVAPAHSALDRCMTPFEEEVWLLVNQRRAEGAYCGGSYHPAAPALAAEQMLHNAAKRHSEDMAIRDFVDHVNPDGDRMADRVAAEEYPWQDLAENIAAGQLTPQSVVGAWIGSEPHCVNIMSPLYTQIGIGYAYDQDDGHEPAYVHYWTLNFGRPDGPTTGPTAVDCPPCDDGLDNDGDGWVDSLMDQGCRDPAGALEDPECDDGLDNDGDGWVDSPMDPGCRDPAGSVEDPKCDDGLDNDGDGFIDWDGFGSGDPDPHCVDRPWGNRENTAACGLGVELALLFPLLTALATRRRA